MTTATSTQSIPPSVTLYLKNLDDRTNKDVLKKTIYYLFSQHGQIADVVVMSSKRERGQAWVVFKEITDATTAMRSLQGFPLFEKSMTITYGKTKSNAVKMREGAYSAGKQTPGPASGPPDATTTGTTGKRPRTEEDDDPSAKRTRQEAG
ncbi:hypothetical protein HKX48_004309, partial [Thoreauomyces humboldtii]